MEVWAQAFEYIAHDGGGMAPWARYQMQVVQLPPAGIGQDIQRGSVMLWLLEGAVLEMVAHAARL